MKKINDENNVTRDTFLINMYNQMFNDINRHINIVWQPITVLVGSFALLAAGATSILSIEIAISLIIILVGWHMANLLDSSYWYNRNLVIIANIERQFLRKSDLHEIHYYFGEHRSKQSMITHMKIQWWLGIFIGVLVLLYYSLTTTMKLFECFTDDTIGFEWIMILPYIAAVVVIIWLIILKNHRMRSYDEFIKNSPGIEIDTSDIVYGVGHPIEKAKGGPKTNEIR